MEMTLAVGAGLLLMLGCVKVFFYFAERIAARQIAYDQGSPELGPCRGEDCPGGRQDAGSANDYVQWKEPTKRLDVFVGDDK